ncbi:hypothetical protein D3C84_828990 [compost metagenome]
MLVTGAMITHQLKRALNIAECITENECVAGGDVIFFPVELPLLDFARERMKAKVDRPHVERAHFGTEFQRGGETVFRRHFRTAACCEVDHGISRFLDPW